MEWSTSNRAKLMVASPVVVPPPPSSNSNAANNNNSNNNNSSSSSNNNNSSSCSSLNPMAVFYSRPGMEDHRHHIHHHHQQQQQQQHQQHQQQHLYPAFEAGSSDQESGGDVAEVNEQEALHHVEKKRRLTVEQVRSLELNFEMENKLEPERKKQLAHELGLQPRQVAVWFQNRRARWKTKQLERDYDSLKASYDALLAENKHLQSEMLNLATKLEQMSCSRCPPLDHGFDTSGTMEVEMQHQHEQQQQQHEQQEQQSIAVQLTCSAPVTALAAKKKKPDKEGSPCSEGYTSEILDAEYPPVPVMEDGSLSAAAGAEAGGIFQQQLVLKDEADQADGVVFDPLGGGSSSSSGNSKSSNNVVAVVGSSSNNSNNNYSNSSSNNSSSSNSFVIPFKFEDGGFFSFSNGDDDADTPPYCYLDAADEPNMAPWWT